MLVALLALSGAHAVDFSAPGACGESISVSVTDMTRSGRFAFLLGYDYGDDLIPAGSCAGTEAGVNMYTYAGPFRANASGVWAMDWDMPEAYCDTAVSVIDLTTCEVSSVVFLGAEDAGGGDAGDGLVDTVDNGDGTFTSAVDATSYDDWVYVDLGTGAEVYPEDPESSLEWDVAFKRFEVAINGGISGMGDASAMWLDADVWGYEIPYLGAIPPYGWVTDEADADDDGAPEYAMGGWYDYDFITHILTPKSGIYLVDGVSGVYAIEFQSYYDEGEIGGNPSFVWNVVDEGGEDVADGLVDTVDNGDGTFTSAVDATSYDDWVYVDLGTGAEVYPEDPESSLEWDIAFKRFDVAINGGISGIGDASAMWLDVDIWGYEVPYLGVVPPFGWVTDEADADDDGTPEYAMADWYDYDFITHVLTPKSGIYLVDGVSGVYAIEFQSYYDDAGLSGNPSFLWNVVD